MSLIRELLERAVSIGASDIHLKEAQEPFFRVKGQLTRSGYEELTAEHLVEITNEMLPEYLARTFADQHEADFSYHEEGVGRFRVNIFQAQGIPTLALRHVKDAIPTIEELQLPPQMHRFAHFARGIVLMTGTTGSGKSSSLAAMIGEINRTQQRRIITVEDPVEYIFEDREAVITQREVGLDTTSYEEALKHLMRQDPDVILIGEMRDKLSIRTALLASETGHLVMSTLHSGTADQAVPRILDVFPREEHDQIRLGLAANLQAVICQRLIPDTHGSVVPAVEILINTPTVRKLLQRNQLETLSAAMETGREDGMQTFNQSIYDHITSGRITEAEGMRFATNPESLRMNLQGIFLDESKRILGGE